MSGPGNPSIFSNSIAPLVIGDSLLDTNRTVDYDVKNITFADKIEVGSVVWEDGFVSGLVEPIANSDVATKFYVDNFSGSASAGGPLTSVQINDGANGFIGYANFTFTEGTGTTTVNGTITNGTITLVGDVLTGLAVPVNNQDAANKEYVDANLTQLGDTEVRTIQDFVNIPQVYTLTYDDLKEKVVNVNFSA